jgi:hypothetical protein
MEFCGAHPVGHDTHHGARSSNRRLIGAAGKVAFEQEQVGAAHHDALGRAVDHALRRPTAVMQRAAVRRVDPDARCAREPRVRATLGAVAMHNVGLGRR